MTARYTDAEKAAAKRIGYAPVLNGDAPDAAWLTDFKRIIIDACNADARYWRARAARIRRKADREAQKADAAAKNMARTADDARTVARAVAREQRKAARS